jgi:hypothetical protein
VTVWLTRLRPADITTQVSQRVFGCLPVLGGLLRLCGYRALFSGGSATFRFNRLPFCL